MQAARMTTMVGLQQVFCGADPAVLCAMPRRGSFVHHLCGTGGQCPERLLEIMTGEEERCDTYIRSLKRLKWQHMEVRGEQFEDVPDGDSIDQLRRLHWGEE